RQLLAFARNSFDHPLDDLLGYGNGLGGQRRLQQFLQRILVVFNQWTLGADFLKETLKVSEEQLADMSFSLLDHIGFSKKDIE
ncbi:hypothetical protein ACC687_40640, partial [Rhizobium ruizarguesonis]